jgi:hypothetical protein
VALGGNVSQPGDDCASEAGRGYNDAAVKALVVALAKAANGIRAVVALEMEASSGGAASFAP